MEETKHAACAKKIIRTDGAPKAVGPYSQAVLAGNLLFVSGQIPIDPVTGLTPETIEDQTELVLKNTGAILRAAGCDYADVVKSTVLLADMNDFAAMNAVYARFYTQDMPARAAYQVVKLPLGVKVEIETIAIK